MLPILRQRLDGTLMCHQQALRLFIEAGMLLTRKGMLPKVMKKLVYIRYVKKYRKWMERLEICVSDDELKNRMEEDRAVMGMMLKYWTTTKTWLS